MWPTPPFPAAAYVRVARLAFLRASTYRIATLGGIVANTAVAFILASVLVSVVSQRGAIEGIDARAAATFAFLVYALDAPVGIFRLLDLGERIRSGDVAVDLYRPFDLQLYWLANEVGAAGFAVLTRLVPPLAFGALVFDLRLPSEPEVVVGFASSLVAAMAVSYGFRFVVALSGFWVLDGRGVQSITGFLVVALSGWVLPLQLYPDWLAAIARALPFATLAQFPAEAFLGMHRGGEIVALVAQQLAWAAALAVLGRMLLGAATRRLVVQGG